MASSIAVSLGIRCRTLDSCYVDAVRRQHPLQPALHLGPLLGDDREIDRITPRAVLVDHVAAQDSLLLGSNPANGGARAGVQGAGLELDTQAVPTLERTPEHQILGLGVGTGALPLGVQPGPADLDPPVGRAGASEPGASDDAARLANHGGEG